MANIYDINYDWITQREMREFMLLDNLLHTDYYLPSLKKALSIEIKDYICEDLFIQINNELNTNTITVANEELRKQLVPAIALFTTYYAMILGYTSRIQNVGTVKDVDSTTSLLDSKAEAWLRSNMMNEAIHFRAEALCFLMNNIANYPAANACFKNICNGCNFRGAWYGSEIEFY